MEVERRHFWVRERIHIHTYIEFFIRIAVPLFGAGGNIGFISVKIIGCEALLILIKELYM